MTVRGHWSEAIRGGEKALEAARKASSESKIARFAHNLAITYQNRGEIEEARRLYNESLEIKKRLGNQSGIASTLHALGLLNEKEGRADEAIRLLREAIPIYEKLKHPYEEMARGVLARLEGEKK